MRAYSDEEHSQQKVGRFRESLVVATTVSCVVETSRFGFGSLFRVIGLPCLGFQRGPQGLPQVEEHFESI